MATASGHTVREQPVCHPIHCVNTGCRDGAARLGTYTAARVGSQERPPLPPIRIVLGHMRRAGHL